MPQYTECKTVYTILRSNEIELELVVGSKVGLITHMQGWANWLEKGQTELEMVWVQFELPGLVQMYEGSWS